MLLPAQRPAGAVQSSGMKGWEGMSPNCAMLKLLLLDMGGSCKWPAVPPAIGAQQ